MNGSSSPGPLAAPNTPIASAKRVRQKVAPRSEPRSSQKLGSPRLKTVVRRIDEEDDEENYHQSTARKLSYNAPSISVNATKTSNKRPLETNTSNSHRSSTTANNNPPPTPSKIMFSPQLRSDSNDQHQNYSSHHHHGRGIDNCESVDTDLDVSEDSMYSPAEEIKQTSMIQEEEDEKRQEMDEDEVDEANDDDYNAFNPYLFIAELPPHELVKEANKICLPAKAASDAGLKTLVLDLDETLVHCTVAPIPDPDLIFPVLFNGTVHQVYVRKRPYLDHFLETISKSFEVVLFTASQRVYADVLLDKLDPKRQYIKYRLFREACLVVQGNYLKDLTVLNRDLTQTMLVDNSPYAYSYQTSNGIPIESWYDDADDTELLKLIGFLNRVQNCDDVRPIIRNHFKTHELVARAKAGRSVPLTAPPF